MSDFIVSAIGLGICVAGIAYLILKGGGEGRKTITTSATSCEQVRFAAHFPEQRVMVRI